MEDGGEDSPRLKVFVIITLPPPDNPSLGKTITAFTVTNGGGGEESLPPQTNHYHEPPETPEIRNPPPQQAQSQRLGQFSFKRMFFGSPILVFAVISMYMMGLYFWVSSTQETFFELRKSDGDRNSNTVILPLFSKMGVQGDFELKLKISADTLLSDPTSNRKTAKSMSAQTDIDSTTIFPIRGNVFPDGLYFTYVLVGTPPRPYFLDVDTGSDLTWIQCDAPCTSCAKGAVVTYERLRAGNSFVFLRYLASEF